MQNVLVTFIRHVFDTNPVSSFSPSTKIVPNCYETVNNLWMYTRDAWRAGISSNEISTRNETR